MRQTARSVPLKSTEVYVALFPHLLRSFDPPQRPPDCKRRGHKPDGPVIKDPSNILRSIDLRLLATGVKVLDTGAGFSGAMELFARVLAEERGLCRRLVVYPTPEYRISQGR
jgi:hypothetical protein